MKVGSIVKIASDKRPIGRKTVETPGKNERTVWISNLGKKKLTIMLFKNKKIKLKDHAKHS